MYEVVEGVATAGVAKAKYAKYAGKAADLAKVEKGFEKTVEVGKTVKRLEKTTDVGKPLKLGEITYKIGVKKKSIFEYRKILGRKVFRNTRDVTPEKPSFVDKSVHKSIRDKINKGWTNKDLMEAGYAPIGPDGKQINLHHLIGEEQELWLNLLLHFIKKS